jgi:hypothetical protein
MALTGHSGRIRASFMHGGETMASRAADNRWRGWRTVRWSVPAVLLPVPLIAHFPWTGSDFVVMGVLLFGSVGIYEAITQASSSRAYRAAAGVAVAASFLLVWINLAVGIIGSENDPLNLLYAGVLGTALIGAILARFGPNGMARALVATATVQALVGIVAVFAARDEPPGMTGQAILNGGFVALWLLSASLFRKAARDGIA